MNWTTPADLRAQLQKLWERGDILASMVSGEPVFPKKLQLKSPTSAEMAEKFSEVRSWIADLRGMTDIRLVMREIRHRTLGINAIPHEIWVDRGDDALALIGKKRQAEIFQKIVAMTTDEQPQLLGWLAKRPLKALELAKEWPLFLAIVTWLEMNPRPGIYLRQVDIPGVHSKFIEANRGVISELLDLALPAEAVDLSAAGVSRFTERYGFRSKPERVRFRILDPSCAILPASSAADITLDAGSFAGLNPEVSRVFITENEVNFLAFPPYPKSMIIFGSGYGFETLRRGNWLERCKIHYWGDIDTHGFAILDQLRSHFPHTESLLMDAATLLACRPLWGEEAQQATSELTRLKPDEMALYNDLRDNRIGRNLRLEQERIGFKLLEAELKRLAPL
jgi:hypothetical protein